MGKLEGERLLDTGSWILNGPGEWIIAEVLTNQEIKHRNWRLDIGCWILFGMAQSAESLGARSKRRTGIQEGYLDQTIDGDEWKIT